MLDTTQLRRQCPRAETVRSGLAEAVDAVRVDDAGGAPLVLEEAQVREGLAHGEAQLVAVQLAPEQHRHQLRGAPRLDERVERLVEPRGVVVAELADALMQAAEWQAV